jgi:phosphoesterase RecJ-like protein
VESPFDADAAAVAILVAELCRAVGAALDADAASCLLVGLASDTGGFRFGNTTPAAFRAAADLVELGADVERVTRWLHESRPEASVRLLGAMLATLERTPDGRIATVHTTLDMFRNAAAELGDAEGLVDVPRSIAGVETVALLRELGPGEWKVSLRSRGTVDVEAVARRHDGGGHRNAAGFTMRGDLQRVRELITASLASVLDSTR